jgi:nicotinate-nucleotide adenylyltransferase
MMRRVGILGGTFDPIHVGHIDLASAAQTTLGLTSVVIMPANVPPHRPAPVASAFHRFAMVAMAISDQTGWIASDGELTEPSRSYTVTTLRRLHDEGYRPTELFFLIGADAFSEISTWKDYPAILDLAHFAVVSRPGTPVGGLRQMLSMLDGRFREPGQTPGDRTSIVLIDAATTDVSGTLVRQRRSAGLSIEALVPPPVLHHIERHALYLSMSTDRRGHADSMTPAAGRLHGQS